MGKLDGRVAIITGATRGLGLEIAKAFMAEGAKIVTWTRGDGEMFRMKKCDALLNYDVLDQKSAEHVVYFGKFDCDKIDILVNCAGIYGPIGPTETVDWEQFEETIRTNLLLPVMMCRAVVPTMRKQGYGKIIQLSGGGATKPNPNASAYAASKAGVVRFAETLAEELRGTGIDVNSMAPGALPTRIQQQIIEAGPEKAGREAYKKAVQTVKDFEENGTPVFCRATDLAVFLASSESDGITGKLLSVYDKPNRGWVSMPTLSADWYTLRRIDGMSGL